MFVASSSPAGAISFLDLSQIPVWRLELAAVGSNLGIGVRYVSAGTTAVVHLAALDLESSGGENHQIAKIGFPKWDRDQNLERLQEAMKILFNADGLRPARVEEIIAQSTKLVDVYHRARESLFAGAEASGYCEGWRWVITQHARVEKWPEA